MTDLRSLSRETLAAELAALNLPAYRADQVFAWLQKRGARSFAEMTDLSKADRARLAERFTLSACAAERKLVSAQDGTVKYLFRLADGEYVESVVMRYRYGLTICVSTQAGCKMGCAFCASGLGGFSRDLLPGEILGQILEAQRDLGEMISRVVLMGMGEPLDNYGNVLAFLRLISHPDGLNISLRKISLSTCGLVPRIHDLRRERLGLTLSVSLHAPNDAVRDRLIPVNRRWPLAELLPACEAYARDTSRRISFEYALIRNVNDSPACARELAGKLRPILCHVNLIPVNDVPEQGFVRSPAAAVAAFAAELEQRGLPATVRRRLGGDIDASCGQLRRRQTMQNLGTPGAPAPLK
ncbi:MAG: 23S rRNA (adenine(2503)-C(2))-methyltransferase RlmN [Oscillospiraceae bacterium]|jgi:23S rRNA (adenine2503-C2)-methyltransferase|nr:23S rRNA (adenine(2503)-C(2))-methyltransferase RlmN [Oscillospiraceae bacterium]